MKDMYIFEGEMIGDFKELIESYEYARCASDGWADDVLEKSVANLAEAMKELAKEYETKLRG